MDGVQLDFDKIPQGTQEYLFDIIIKGTRKAMLDPEWVEGFNEWKAEREKESAEKCEC